MRKSTNYSQLAGHTQTGAGCIWPNGRQQNVPLLQATSGQAEASPRVKPTGGPPPQGHQVNSPWPGLE